METNIYRVIKRCKKCPFSDNGKAMLLNKGRVENIKENLLSDDNNSFSCHETVYCSKPKPKMCAGAYGFLKKHNKPNIMMKLALAMRIEA